jgi:hypothetical protein
MTYEPVIIAMFIACLLYVLYVTFSEPTFSKGFKKAWEFFNDLAPYYLTK